MAKPTPEPVVRVAGQHPVLGHQPGEEFTPNVPPEQLARMIARGSLHVIPPARTVADHKQQEEE